MSRLTALGLAILLMFVVFVGCSAPSTTSSSIELTRALPVSFDRAGMHLLNGHLSLRCVGRGGCSAVLGATPQRTEQGVAYARGSVREWYVETADGVEQGFTIAVRPPGVGPLVVTTAVSGFTLQTIGERIWLRSSKGTLRVEQLHAFDADHRELQAWMTGGDGALAIHVDDAGARYPLTIDPLYASESVKITSADAPAYGTFGSSLSRSGDTAIVGLPSGKGMALIFMRSGSTWTQQAKLQPADLTTVGLFGSQVAISGDTAVASGKDSVYVFQRSGTTWTESKLLAPETGASFGNAVVIAGTTMVIGAPMTGSPVTGAAYVYIKSGTTWTQQAKLLPSDASVGGSFGARVAISGETIVVGAPNVTIGAKNYAGAAYVYTRTGTAWSEQTRLIAADGASFDSFGNAVTISGDTAIAGAPYANAAYAFTRSGTTWSAGTKLVAKDAATGDRFGSAVSLAGELVAIGADAAENGSAATLDSGAAYVFRRSGTTWTQEVRLTATDPEKYASFGKAIDFDGTNALIAAPFADAGAVIDAGAIYSLTLAATKASGAACSTNAECTTGFCTDSFCCDKACGGPCEACSAAKKGAGVDGACAPISADTDPKSACAPGSGACAADGMCDGASNCRSFAKAGTPCGATTCASGSVTGKTCKGSTAECIDTTTLCAPYACGAMACNTKCTGDAECAAEAYCSTNVCKPKLANGLACGGARECGSGFCVDGVCCNAACTGQCESCAEEKGSCVAIKGLPRAPRMACSGDPACGGSCNGINGGSCTFKVGSECATSCAAAAETISTCDDKGACVAGGAKGCPGFVCDGATRCKNSCAAPADCLDKFSCVSGACVPQAAKCSANGLAVEVDGKSTSCGVTLCRDGRCIEECKSTNDCASGYVCNGTKCERPPTDTGDSGGCTMTRGGSGSAPFALLAILGTALVARRRRWALALLAASSCRADRAPEPVSSVSSTRDALLYGTDVTKIAGTDTAADDFLGYKVALAGDTAIVTAIGASYGGSSRAGAAYAFVRSGATWTQQAKLVPSDPRATGRFGEAAAFSNDIALIGSSDGDLTAPTEAGVVYSFQRSGTTWTQLPKITPTVRETNAKFGLALAVDGTTLVVGAPASFSSGKPGAAYVFVRSGTAWIEQAKLTAADGVANDAFGGGVAISGDTAVIGASGAKIGANASQGAAYVFTRTGTAWAPQTKLVAADGAPSDRLGQAVAVSGATVILGVQLASIGGKSAVGAAYIFTRSGTTWSPQAKVTHAGGIATDLFGSSVALAGDTALIGAEALDVGLIANAGGVFVFTRVGTSWTESARVVATDPKKDRGFGHAIAFDADWAITGDPYADFGAVLRSGVAYPFRLAPTKANGGACGAAGECTSGQCVEGVCCDKPCSGVCESCTALKKGSGVDGTCAPVAADTDPKDACPVSAGTCPADGACDGAGSCRSFAKAGTPCGVTTCATGSVTGKICKGSSAECMDTTTVCAPYACGTTACKTSCATDADCTTDAYCATSVCKPKLTNGAACTIARECASGTCVDGVCCDKPCGGQCESCAETKGTCLAVKGAPRSGRAACGGGTMCAGACNGVNGGACTYPAGAECATTCSAGSETVSACDMSGMCVSAAPKTCAGFACDGTARCRKTCTSAAECEAQFVCTAGVCEPKPAPKCSADGLSVELEGKTTSCGATLCRGGKCLELCNSTSDCAPTYVCNGTKCEQPTASPGGEDTGSCAMSSAPHSPGLTPFALALALTALRRRRSAQRSNESAQRDIAVR